MPPCRLLCCALFVAGHALLGAGPAFAQRPGTEPIRSFVVDVRGVWARYGESPALAESRGFAPGEQPSSGIGLQGGVHAYPFRWGAVTFGFGGDFVWTRGSRTPDPAAEPEPEPDPDPEAPPPAVPRALRTRFTTLAPAISLNFGSNDGWSYISGGIGLATLSLTEIGQPAEDSPWIRTLHYGGGARWFARPHLAFTFDVRFHILSATAPSPGFAGSPRSSFTTLSAGIAIH